MTEVHGGANLLGGRVMGYMLFAILRTTSRVAQASEWPLIFSFQLEEDSTVTTVQELERELKSRAVQIIDLFSFLSSLKIQENNNFELTRK